MPQSRVQTSLTLFGSAPWGFRISGGKEFNQPIVITRVTPGSLASKSGIQSGDVLIAINSQYVSQMTQDECEVAVKQAVGSLHLVLEKNAATVTELPGGQYKVEGDRSVYTALKDEQQRLSKFNRSAKPFGAPSKPVSSEAAPVEPAEQQKSGYKPVAFKPKPQSGAPSTDSGAGDTDIVGSTTQSMSNVNLGTSESQASTTPTKTYNSNKYNRKVTPFPGSSSSNSNGNNSTGRVQEDLPPPPDFILNANASEAGQPSKHRTVANVAINNPKSVISRKVIASQSLGLYSQSNVGDVYDAQIGDQ